MSEQLTKGLDEKFCSTCGAIIKIAAEICPKCGVRQINTNSSGDPNASDKSKTSAALLCFFLGFCGAHRFYVGKIGLGVLNAIMFVVAFLFYVFGFVFVQSYKSDVRTAGGVLVVLGGILFVAIGIWVFVDLIIILVGSYKDKQGRKVLN